MRQGEQSWQRWGSCHNSVCLKPDSNATVRSLRCLHMCGPEPSNASYIYTTLHARTSDAQSGSKRGGCRRRAFRTPARLFPVASCFVLWLPSQRVKLTLLVCMCYPGFTIQIPVVQHQTDNLGGDGRASLITTGISGQAPFHQFTQGTRQNNGVHRAAPRAPRSRPSPAHETPNPRAPPHRGVDLAD
jgi:hypothetical protein